MVLFVSDIHFSRYDDPAARASEAALIRCLRTFEGEVRHLYLLGDVFDQYIEYRHLVPKGFVRFQALLADWTDRGIGVTYLVGNHDPWHHDYFERELGVRLRYDAFDEPLFGYVVHMAHGDGLVPGRLYNHLKPVLRHRVPVWLYRSLLPGDLGHDLARWARRFIGHDEVEPETVETLRILGLARIARGEAQLVVMGHSHQPELQAAPEGCYLNTGSWLDDRTFARLDPGEIQLLRWNGTVSERVDAAPMPR